MPRGIRLTPQVAEQHWDIKGRRHVVCIPMRGKDLGSRTAHAEMSPSEARALASQLYTQANEAEHRDRMAKAQETA